MGVPLKNVEWHGAALSDIRLLPLEIRQRFGYQLHRVQLGLEPTDWRPMRQVGSGVREIRIAYSGRAFRLVYVLGGEETVHVLHVFEKKSRRTARHDLEIVRRRFAKARRPRAGDG